MSSNKALFHYQNMVFHAKIENRALVFSNINENFKTLTGYTKEEIIYAPIEIILPS